MAENWEDHEEGNCSAEGVQNEKGGEFNIFTRFPGIHILEATPKQQCGEVGPEGVTTSRGFCPRD